jgi:Alpha-(1->3)-arabinofuranosyltransferase
VESDGDMFLQFGSLSGPGTAIPEDERRQLGQRLKHLATDPRIRWVWLLVLLPTAVLWPALTQNIAALAYDAALEHVPRGVVFSQAISDGVLYPRWTQFLHWGLGSPLFTFQPPLPYYGLDLLYRMGLPHPIGWRLLMAMGLAAAFFGAYLLVHTVTGQRWPAVVAGVAYLYAPYVLRNGLERGSNEAYGMFLYPWVLWGLIWVARRPSAGRFVVATLLWAASIGSHVLAPLILAPFALLLAAYMAWRHRSWAPLGVLVAGGLLTAAVWIPMIPEQSYVQVERDFTYIEAIPAQNSIPLDALLASPAIYDTARDNNGSGDRVGTLSAMILVAGIPGTAIAWSGRRRTLAVALGASTLAGLLIFWMLTGASDPLWASPGVGALLARLLYRTRLMGLLSLGAACTAGLLVALLSVRRQRVAGLLLAGLLILTALPSLYLELQHRYGQFGTHVSLADVRATEIATGGNALTAFGEFTPRWREAPFDEVLLQELGPDHDPQQRPLRNPSEEVEVRTGRVASSAWDLELVGHQATTATFYLLYYPRWLAWLDGQPAVLRPEPGSGYAQLDLPAGSHRITLRYGPTAAETTGLLVSGLTLLALLAATGWALLRSAGRRVPVRGAAVSKVPVQFRCKTTTAPSSGDAKGVEGGAPPPVWLLLGATALLVFKLAVVDSATTWFRCASTPARVCGAEATVDIPFPEAPSLRGYVVPTYKAKAGDELQVSLFWQGEPGAARHLSSFVHVRNSQRDQPLNPRTGSDIWAQEDRDTPGGLPPEDYVAGKLYRDDFRVTLPGDIPPGNYLLEVGLADPATGEQLDPQADAVQPPLKVLWRSILLPSVEIR